MIDEKKVNIILKLRSKTEQLQSDRDKAKGALERTLHQIEEQFDCNSIESGEKQLQQMQRKYKRMVAKRDRTIEEYQQEMEGYEDE